MPIRDFKDRRTADFMAGRRVKDFEAIERQAAKALVKLQVATCLKDLFQPPSNRFEALQGNRVGQFSIRINDKWRICFKWHFIGDDLKDINSLLHPGEAYDVEIVDYH